MSITWSPVRTDHWAAKKYLKVIDIFLTEKQFYLTLINHCAYKIVLKVVLFIFCVLLFELLRSLHSCCVSVFLGSLQLSYMWNLILWFDFFLDSGFNFRLRRLILRFHLHFSLHYSLPSASLTWDMWELCPWILISCALTSSSTKCRHMEVIRHGEAVILSMAVSTHCCGSHLDNIKYLIEYCGWWHICLCWYLSCVIKQPKPVRLYTSIKTLWNCKNKASSKEKPLW